MKRITTIVLLSTLSMSAFVSAHAEQLFVSDKLVIGVYAQANQESEKLASLESGDAVDAIEKIEGYTHVKLTDGRQGWIKSSYLSAQASAAVRLKELEKERAASAASIPAHVAEELKQLKEQNTTLRDEVDALKKAAAQKAAIKPTPPANTSSSLKERDNKLEEDLPLHALEWGAGIAAIAVVFGFFLGHRTIVRRIERKYGKLKIY